MAQHSHTITANSGSSTGGSNPQVSPGAVTNTPSTGGGGAHNHPVSANFSGDSNSVLQPYITMVYIIKT